MKLVILESPYAGNIERNIRYARACVRDCLDRRESAIASHLLFTQEGILNDAVPEERIRGIAAGWAWSRVADYIVFYEDLGWSRGMLGARQLYESRGVPFEIRTLGDKWQDR